MSRMVRSFRIAAALLVVFAPAVQLSVAQSLAGAAKNAPIRSALVKRAQSVVIRGLRDGWGSNPNGGWGPHPGDGWGPNAQIQSESVTFDHSFFGQDGKGDALPNGHYKLDLRNLERLSVEDAEGRYLFLLFNGIDPCAGPRLHATYLNKRSYPDSVLFLNCVLKWFPDSDSHARSEAQAFADALNLLSACARGELTVDDAAVWRDFEQKAAAWRALPARPPLSDSVRKQQLLAEDAVKEKQFEAAAAAYDAGTQIDPMWPEGHFNAAAIYGELKDYDDAVWHMRCYLELLPNAPDAQTARDQMLLWQAKAEQAAAAQ